MAVRESILGLSESSSNLQLLQDSFRRIQGLGDDRGYEWFASIHGLAFPSWCEHGRVVGNEYQGALLFLPWHRAFLYYFELALQSRLGPRFTQRPPENADFAEIGLPWWDWSSDDSHRDGIPPAYAVDEIDGQQNPLASARVSTAADPVSVGIWSTPILSAVRQQLPGSLTTTNPPRTRRDPDDPDELPRRTTVDQIVLTQPNFQSFATSVEMIHNDVHGWVGGSMAQVPTSAYDPLFWSHHCMIDRLWYLWQNSAFGRPPPPDILNTVLAPFPMTVADVLDINVLGYEYAVQSVVFA